MNPKHGTKNSLYNPLVLAAMMVATGVATAACTGATTAGTPANSARSPVMSYQCENAPAATSATECAMSERHSRGHSGKD